MHTLEAQSTASWSLSSRSRAALPCQLLCRQQCHVQLEGVTAGSATTTAACCTANTTLLVTSTLTVSCPETTSSLSQLHGSLGEGRLDNDTVSASDSTESVDRRTRDWNAVGAMLGARIKPVAQHFNAGGCCSLLCQVIRITPCLVNA